MASVGLLLGGLLLGICSTSFLCFHRQKKAAQRQQLRQQLEELYQHQEQEEEQRFQGMPGDGTPEEDLGEYGGGDPSDGEGGEEMRPEEFALSEGPSVDSGFGVDGIAMGIIAAVTASQQQDSSFDGGFSRMTTGTADVAPAQRRSLESGADRDNIDFEVVTAEVAAQRQREATDREIQNQLSSPFQHTETPSAEETAAQQQEAAMAASESQSDSASSVSLRELYMTHGTNATYDHGDDGAEGPRLSYISRLHSRTVSGFSRGASGSQQRQSLEARFGPLPISGVYPWESEAEAFGSAGHPFGDGTRVSREGAAAATAAAAAVVGEEPIFAAEEVSAVPVSTIDIHVNPVTATAISGDSLAETLAQIDAHVGEQERRAASANPEDREE